MININSADMYSQLETICKKQQLQPIKTINIKGKDYGLCRMDIGEDFEIRIYDLELEKKVGFAEFNLSWTGLFKEFYNINLIEEKAYNEYFQIRRDYQGLGLSKILLEESINTLIEKHQPHIVQFVTVKGRDRLKQQFIDKGYEQTIPKKKNYPLVIYKKY